MSYKDFENEISDKKLLELIKEKYTENTSNTSIYFSILMMHELSYIRQISSKKYPATVIQEKKINTDNIRTIYNNVFKELYSDLKYDDIEDNKAFQLINNKKTKGAPQKWSKEIKESLVKLVEEEKEGKEGKIISDKHAINNLITKIKNTNFKDDILSHNRLKNKYRLLKGVKYGEITISRTIYLKFKKELSKM